MIPDSIEHHRDEPNSQKDKWILEKLKFYVFTPRTNSRFPIQSGLFLAIKEREVLLDE
jgi:hypothetical protein